MNRLLKFLEAQSYLRLGAGALALTYVLPTMLLWSLDGLGVISAQRLRHPAASEFDQMQLVLQFLIVCIVGPLFETLFFQWGPLSLIPLRGATQQILGVVGTALAFGLMHTQSVGAFASTTVSGIVLSLVCLALLRAHRAAFVTVFAVHAVRNAIALTVRAMGLA